MFSCQLRQITFDKNRVFNSSKDTTIQQPGLYRNFLTSPYQHNKDPVLLHRSRRRSGSTVVQSKLDNTFPIQFPNARYVQDTVTKPYEMCTSFPRNFIPPVSQSVHVGRSTRLDERTRLDHKYSKPCTNSYGSCFL